MRQIAPAAGNVIQFDRRNGINRVALDLLTPASNTHLLTFPYNTHSPNSNLPPPFPASFSPHFFISYSGFPPLLLLSFCPLPPLPRFLGWFIESPITRAQLFPLLTNTGVRPGTTQVCHEQVGGTVREIERAHRTLQLTANARPPTHAHTLTDSLAERHEA